jgi:hypothetical protein
LEVAFRNKLPEIRKSLFGKVGAAWWVTPTL